MNARFIFGTFVACLLFLRAWGDVAQAQPALGAFADVSAHWAEPPVGGTVTNSANGALVAQPPVAIVVADTYHALDPEGASARAIAMVSPAPGEKFLRALALWVEIPPSCPTRAWMPRPRPGSSHNGW